MVKSGALMVSFKGPTHSYWLAHNSADGGGHWRFPRASPIANHGHTCGDIGMHFTNSFLSCDSHWVSETIGTRFGSIRSLELSCADGLRISQWPAHFLLTTKVANSSLRLLRKIAMEIANILLKGPLDAGAGCFVLRCSWIPYSHGTHQRTAGMLSVWIFIWKQLRKCGRGACSRLALKMDQCEV